MARRRRGSPPPDEWPGRDITVEDVLDACDDERDWFSRDMRLQAYYDQMNRFDMAFKRGRPRHNLPDGRPFPFGQIMVVGPMGTKKSVGVGCEAAEYNSKGYPFFHTGGWLFGRLVSGAEVYEMVDRVPIFCIIATDEAHTTFESGLSGSTGVRAWNIESAGFRKNGVRTYMPTAKAVMLSPQIRQWSDEVWRCVPVTVGGDVPSGTPPYKDPRNFVLGFQKWKGFPLQKADIFDAPANRGRGLGKPDQTTLRIGQQVREAFKLTDSFMPVLPSQAMQYALKDPMTQQRERENVGEDGLTAEQRAIIIHMFKRCNGMARPEYIKADAIAFDLGIKRSVAQGVLAGVFGDVDEAMHPAKGYSTEVCRVALLSKFGNLQEAAQMVGAT